MSANSSQRIFSWGVITSYSIHYTKLYDRHRRCGAAAARITSYNVCYTKLLRGGRTPPLRPDRRTAGAGHPLRAGAERVITSYSIHYTKLYDRHRRCGAAAARITSYNVCYTKLLRSANSSQRIFCWGERGARPVLVVVRSGAGRAARAILPLGVRGRVSRGTMGVGTM
nr:hypothetical protein [Streptomyces cyaneogriseus]